MKRLFGTFLTAAVLMIPLLTVGCGPDADLVRSGVAHRCEMDRINAELNEDMHNEELLRELAERGELFEAVIGSEDEGKQAALRERIQEVYQSDGCPE